MVQLGAEVGEEARGDGGRGGEGEEGGDGDAVAEGDLTGLDGGWDFGVGGSGVGGLA